MEVTSTSAANDESVMSIKRHVVYFYGPPGSGRTHAAMEWLINQMQKNHEEAPIDELSIDHQEIAGYTGSKYVLLDPWDMRDLSLWHWCRLFSDEEWYLAEEGMDEWWNAEYIALVGEKDPSDFGDYGIFPFETEHVAQHFETYWRLEKSSENPEEAFYLKEEMPVDELLKVLKFLSDTYYPN